MYSTLSYYSYFILIEDKTEHFSDFNTEVVVYPNANSYCKDIVQYIKQAAIQSSKPKLSIIHISEYPSKVDQQSFIVLISGEPDPIFHKVGVTIAPFLWQPKPSIYYPFLYQSLSERKQFNYPIQSKVKTCAFMYRKNYIHRNEWFHRIHKYIHVDALGTSCNNTNIASTRHINNEDKTYNDIAVDMYCSYYFVLAIENTWKEGYFTEKLINPIMAHSIPLYWGHPQVFEYINKKRVIYLPDFNTDEDIIKRIQDLQQDPVAYKKIIEEPWYTEKGEPENVVNQIKKELREYI
jgi:hypothetical protein